MLNCRATLFFTNPPQKKKKNFYKLPKYSIILFVCFLKFFL